MVKAMALMGLLGLTACSAKSIPPSANTPEKATVINLEREKQRVVRFDCGNNVISDGFEQVHAPEEFVKIEPAGQDFATFVTASDFRNVTTHDGPDLIVGHTKFTVTYDAGIYMRVRPGVNEITYSFQFSDGDIETGSRFIDVFYSERVLSGERYEHPQPEDCP